MARVCPRTVPLAPPLCLHPGALPRASVAAQNSRRPLRRRLAARDPGGGREGEGVADLNLPPAPSISRCFLASAAPPLGRGRGARAGCVGGNAGRGKGEMGVRTGADGGARGAAVRRLRHDRVRPIEHGAQLAPVQSFFFVFSTARSFSSRLPAGAAPAPEAGGGGGGRRRPWRGRGVRGEGGGGVAARSSPQ